MAHPSQRGFGHVNPIAESVANDIDGLKMLLPLKPLAVSPGPNGGAAESTSPLGILPPQLVVVRGGGVLPAEHPSGQRIVRVKAHAHPPQRGEEILLDLARDGVVHSLINGGEDVPPRVHVTVDVYDLPGREVAQSKPPKFPPDEEPLNFLQGGIDRVARVRGVEVIDVNVVAPEGSQRGLQLIAQSRRREVLVGGEGVRLGGHAARQRMFLEDAPYQSLGLAVLVHDRGVKFGLSDKIRPTRIVAKVHQNFRRIFFGCLAAERHGAEDYTRGGHRIGLERNALRSSLWGANFATRDPHFTSLYLKYNMYLYLFLVFTISMCDQNSISTCPPDSTQNSSCGHMTDQKTTIADYTDMSTCA